LGISLGYGFCVVKTKREGNEKGRKERRGKKKVWFLTKATN